MKKNTDFNYSELYQINKRTVPSISVWHTIYFFVIRNIHCFIAVRWVLNANDSIHEGLSKQKCLVCDSTREKKIERKRSNANACFVIANIAQTLCFYSFGICTYISHLSMDNGLSFNHLFKNVCFVFCVCKW